jgi:hypothetical protein
MEYIEKFLYGNQQLAPELYGEDFDQPLLVPSSRVQDGARMLRDIEPSALFDITENPHSYYLDQFRWWREFYLEADAKGEAVVIIFF